jgi:hypothetical protein
MADNDFNIIKPVESLQNIAGLTPARRREERKRRHSQQEQEPQEAVEGELNKSAGNQTADGEFTENENGRLPDDTGIDYRA